MTEKRNKDIKARACADGRKQKLWTKKEDSASPTIACECLFQSCEIDARENRDVATGDLPGFFLQSPMKGRVILRLDGPLALLLVEINPKIWKKHLRNVRGRDVIYVKCSKAIYGTVTAALLSYRKLRGHLEDWGFEMNPYEPCCFNQMINGKQMTIVFHVDDLKLSHVDPDVVTDILRNDELYSESAPIH